MAEIEGSSLINPLLKETFNFRPYQYPRKTLLRYAEGKWIPDDGKPDMAFVYRDARGFPIVEYIKLPYYTNILWSWHEVVDGKRIWHCCTTNNDYWYNYHYEERDEHPNEVAGRSAMNKCSGLYSCANGHGIDIDKDNDYIKQGKLTIVSTGKPVVKPDSPVCFLCLNNKYGHRLDAIEHKKAELERDKRHYQNERDKSISTQYDSEEYLRIIDEHLEDVEKSLIELRKENNARD